MMKLSIIVPIYNVEQYLQKCVDSLLNQDIPLSEYEIILVDDGGKDKCPQICDDYAAVHENIRVVHRENGGLSAARNNGIEVARGKYIQFVDSDDYLEPNVLRGLIEQMEQDRLDVLRYDYQDVRLKGDGQYEVFQPNKSPHYVDRRREVVDGETYLNERMSGYACYAWQYVIKRELTDMFMPGIYFEDTEWTPRMLMKAKRVGSTSTIVYNYFWREGSITKAYNKEHIRKKIESLLNVNISLLNLLPKAKDKRWINGCIADNVYAILNNVAAYDYESVAHWIDRLKKDHMLPLQGYKIRKMTKFRYGIINMSPRLYCWLRHIRMKYLR